MSRINKKGRNKSPPFVMLYHSLVDTPAWLDLSGNAVKLLVHMVRLCNGSNNGEITLSERRAADEVGMARNTVAAAFNDLEAHGFIAVARPGAFSVKVKRATAWRLTFLPSGNKAPTHEYREWLKAVPETEQFRKRNSSGSGTLPCPAE